MSQLCGMSKIPSVFLEIAALMGEGIVPAFAGRGLAYLHDARRLWR
jgi:hypothetical protein